MSTLVLLLPPRTRLRAQGAGTSEPTGPAIEYDYLLTLDGITATKQGRCAPSLLPRTDSVVAVPAETDLSWHHLTLPKTGRPRMRAALAGMMEESLLDDTEQLHFAVETDAAGGDKAWVAVMHRASLVEHLAALEAAQVFVDRVAPLAWPSAPPQGHFYPVDGPEQGDHAPVGLHWSHPEGVAHLRLDGTLLRTLFPAGAVPAGAQWTATPEVAEAAERWLDAPVVVTTPVERILKALEGPWNLRQFDLAPRARGVRAVRQLYRGYMRRAWRPVRLGLLGLAVVQLVGLNLWAWHQRNAIEARKLAIEQVLRSTHPQVRAILDAPVQMQRETDLLRGASGLPGDDDLESLLGAAASAWPTDLGPLDTLRFEPGRLTLSSNGWRNDQIEAFRSALTSDGWLLDASEGRLVISKIKLPAGASMGNKRS